MKRRIGIKGLQWIGFLLLLAAMGVGFSYLTTNLNIEGITRIDKNTWDVHFEHVEVSYGSIEGEKPEITSATQITFAPVLSKPGEYYEFTVDVINTGLIDAMVDSIHSTVNELEIEELPDYLEYKVTYLDGQPIQKNQKLLSNEKETYLVRIEYKENIKGNSFKEEAIIIQLEASYVQATSEATNRFYYRYRVGDDYVRTGTTLSEDITMKENIYDYLRKGEPEVFIRHTVNGENKIVNTELGYYQNGIFSYVQGGDASKAVYTSNQSIYQKNFKDCVENKEGIYCPNGFAEKTGYVWLQREGRYCYIMDTGLSSCISE
ncbi:MAG: hypothetical protein J6X28_01195 [Bacilli bacterium]|nr:hypothetical protein [Bacilli bacterium]